jgi:hypothetical protein
MDTKNQSSNGNGMHISQEYWEAEFNVKETGTVYQEKEGEVKSGVFVGMTEDDIEAGVSAMKDALSNDVNGSFRGFLKLTSWFLKEAAK